MSMKTPISLFLTLLAPVAFSATLTATVPVLKQPLAKGQLVTAEDLTSAEIPSNQVFQSTFTQAEATSLIGQQATKPLQAGEPLNKLHLRVPPVVERNSTVTLRFQRGGIELSSSAQALQDGTLGQSIKVLNPVTRATVLGTVTAPGVVEVN